jgi:hypothetical protein
LWSEATVLVATTESGVETMERHAHPCDVALTAVLS